MLPQNLPTFTKSDLDAKCLTGLFMAAETIVFHEFHIDVNSYVFLKDSMIHNEHGPAVITINKPKHVVSTLIFCRNNNFYIAPNPFSALDFSYPETPSQIDLSCNPTWNGSQFIYSPKDIWGFIFINNLGEFHSEHGPAHAKKFPLYFLSGKSYLKPEWVVELHKRAILDLIKTS